MPTAQFQYIPTPDPLGPVMSALGGGIGRGLSEASTNYMLSQAMQGLDINDPASVTALLNRANPILRPQIAEMIKQQYDIRGRGVEQKREDIRFEREGKEFEQKQKIGQLNIEEAERQKVSTAIARDQQFTNLVGTKLEKLDDLGKSAFIDMSKKYVNELNPEIRYQKTLKDYTVQMERVAKIGERIGKIGSFRKDYVGLKQGDLNAISEDVKNSIDSGVDPRIVENTIKTSGLNTNDIEAVMSRNYAVVKKIVEGIKPPAKRQVAGQAGLVGTLQQVTEKDIVALVPQIAKAIKIGGSLDYLYSALIDKGYKALEAQTVIRQAAMDSNLTDRQKVQLSNLEKSRQSLLGRIFGEVLEPTGV